MNYGMSADSAILGFDPGRDKCGIAVMGSNRQLFYHEVIAAEVAIATISRLRQKYRISILVMGDQTTAKVWKRQIEQDLPEPPPIMLVDKRYSTLEARDRYWEMYPPSGLSRLVPKGMRPLPRPVDDIVAILLIERYLSRG